jgi:hypothetical protein
MAEVETSVAAAKPRESRDFSAIMVDLPSCARAIVLQRAYGSDRVAGNRGDVVEFARAGVPSVA